MDFLCSLVCSPVSLRFSYFTQGEAYVWRECASDEAYKDAGESEAHVGGADTQVASFFSSVLRANSAAQHLFARVDHVVGFGVGANAQEFDHDGRKRGRGYFAAWGAD